MSKILLDIFSSLDYNLSNFSFFNIFSLSWLVVFLLAFSVCGSFYMIFYNFFFSNFFFGAWLERKKGAGGFYIFFSGILCFIFFQKILGLFPYTFSSTSHIMFKFIVAFELWLGVVFFGFLKHFVSMLGHFSPFGSPLVLANFLNLMEVVSVMIRSLTLSLRLAVNISTGHIFLGLVSSWLLMCGSFSVWVFSFVCFVGYFFFEIFVCFIQALVFSLLLVQYLDEV